MFAPSERRIPLILASVAFMAAALSACVIADGSSQAEEAEAWGTAEQAAAKRARCGDGVCGSREDCSSCSSDCGACETCGDGLCGGSESCSSCSEDCGTCRVCGDGACTGGETCSSCSEDCGCCAGDPGCTIGCPLGTQACLHCKSTLTKCDDFLSCGLYYCGYPETCVETCEPSCEATEPQVPWCIYQYPG